MLFCLYQVLYLESVNTISHSNSMVAKTHPGYAALADLSPADAAKRVEKK
jgi:hypothetical protein